MPRFQWNGATQPRTYNYEELAAKQLSPKMSLKLCRDLDQQEICLDLRKYFLAATGLPTSTHKGIYLDIESWKWVRDELNRLLGDVLPQKTSESLKS